MKIQVGDYYINADQWCMYITEKVKSEETGRLREKRVTGYRQNFDLLIRDFVHAKTVGAEANTVTEACKLFAKAVEDAEALNAAALKNDLKELRRVTAKKRAR